MEDQTKVVITVVATTKGACTVPPPSLTERTGFGVFLSGSAGVNGGGGRQLDAGAKVHRRLSPAVQAACSNLLTEDVLQQILSCTQGLGCRARATRARARAGPFPDVIPRRFFAAQCEWWGLRWS